MISVRKDPPARSAFERTPFGVLGASTRDNRHRIVELAETKNLTVDGDLLSRARSDLTNPRARVSAEVAWLPGLSPARASSLCDLLRRDLEAFLAAATNESPLVQANMIAAALEWFDPLTEAHSWVKWILSLADASGRVQGDAVLRILNEDRAVAGIPEIPMLEFLDSELGLRRRSFRSAVKDALDRIPTGTMLQVITQVATTATDNGTRQAPLLIDEIIDIFEVEAGPFFDREADNARRLMAAVASSRSPEAVVQRLLEGVERVVRNWVHVAKPIYLSMRPRGLEHTPSHKLANELRGLSIRLNNDHGLFEPSQRITSLLQHAFADLFSLADQVQQDANTLKEIAEEQQRSREQREQWARDIAFEAELGLVIKDRLRLSTEGVEWKGSRYRLEAITRIGWGATRHSVNGIPTGTSYKIFVGDDQNIAEIRLGNAELFTGFVERLWRAVGPRLVTELLRGLREGKRYHFGQAILDDRGIDVPKHRWFKADERVYGTWDKIHVWAADGSFHIGAKGDKKTFAALPYQEANNTLVLETAIRAAFEKGADRLSDILSVK
jgi:hypothetical protein